MKDAPQKTSEELAVEVQRLMPTLKSVSTSWWGLIFRLDDPTFRMLYPVAQLVLAQQEEIEQLKAEINELKQQK